MSLPPLQVVLDLKGNFAAQMKAAGGDASNFGSTIKNVGGQTAGAIGLITTGFAGMAGNVKSGFALLTGNYGELGNMLGQLPGPVGIVGKAIGDSLGAAMDETVKYTEAMRKASVTTGASVSFISQFTEAADDQFISQEKVTAALGKFSRGLGGVQDMEGGFTQSGKGVAQVLDDMGIKAADANGKMLPMEALIPQLADKFRAMGPGVKATALAVQLFGKSGADMLPVLLQGSAAMKQSMDAAAAMGLSIDEKAVMAVTRLKQQQDALGDASTAVGRKISIAVIPALAELTKSINSVIGDGTGLAKTIDWLFHGFDSAETKATRFNDALLAGGVWMGSEAMSAEKLAEKLDVETKATIAAHDAMLEHVGSYQSASARAGDYERSALAVAAAQGELKARTDEVIGAIADESAAMTEAERVKTIVSLATGKLTIAETENKLAVQGVMKALEDGSLSEEQAVRTIKGLADGTLTAQQAFVKAGQSGAQFKTTANDLKAAALAASGAVYGLNTNLNALPASRNVTVSVGKGANWEEIFGVNGVVQSLHDSTVTKTIAGAGSKSFNDAKSWFDGLYDDTATKTVDGCETGNFADAYRAYGSVVNGSATVQYNFTATLSIPPCFIAGTLVATPSGDRAIETMRVGDAVMAYDHERREPVASVVTKTFIHRNIQTLALVLSNHTIIHTTPEHPFWTGDAYTPAGDLRPGDQLMTIGGEWVTVGIVFDSMVADVYNIEVETYHNYFAGDVLVHNGKSAPVSGGGGADSNNMVFQNSFGGGMSARATAQMVQQAQRAASRQAMLRASIGG